MVLRLDPHLPVVWRTPTSVQFGVTRPAVVLDNVSTATEKLIAALSAGISSSGLAMIGRSAGATDAEVEALVARLSPALLANPPAAQPTVAVAGTGRLSDRVAAVLAEAGVRVMVARSASEAETVQCSLAIAVGHFVLDPGYYGVWLRRDVPHLPVVLGDSAVSVGPLVEPGRSACLYCLQLHANDADGAWPAIASQLWGRRSPLDTELVASEVAAIVARRVLAVLRGEPVVTDQLVVDGGSGLRVRREYGIHPSCGCAELEAAIAGGRRETDSALGAGPATSPTTKDTAASVRA